MSKIESIKVVLLGDTGVGKTDIIHQIIKHKFVSDPPATLI